MGHFASSLHRLAKLSRAAVVIVNEARGGGGADSSSSSSSSMSNNKSSSSSSSSTTDTVVKPALGQSWGYTASVRLGLCAVPSSQLLAASKKPHPGANRQPPTLSEAAHRISATILKHPRSPAAIPGGGSLGSSAVYNSSVEFLVGPSGVC